MQHGAINSIIQFGFKVGLHTYTLRLGSIHFLLVCVVITDPCLKWSLNSENGGPTTRFQPSDLIEKIE